MRLYQNPFHIFFNSTKFGFSPRSCCFHSLHRTCDFPFSFSLMTIIVTPQPGKNFPCARYFWQPLKIRGHDRPTLSHRTHTHIRQIPRTDLYFFIFLHQLIPQFSVFISSLDGENSVEIGRLENIFTAVECFSTLFLSQFTRYDGFTRRIFS